jgi:hypothetical protein
MRRFACLDLLSGTTLGVPSQRCALPQPRNCGASCKLGVVELSCDLPACFTMKRQRRKRHESSPPLIFPSQGRHYLGRGFKLRMLGAAASSACRWSLARLARPSHRVTAAAAAAPAPARAAHPPACGVAFIKRGETLTPLRSHRAAVSSGSALNQAAMSGTVVLVGDVHGHSDKLRSLWRELEKALGSERFNNARVILLGDLCDRGGAVQVECS